MPEYIYKHPEKDEYVSVIQRMTEPHEFLGEDGVKWKRVFSCPQMSISTRIDPFSKNSFLDKTATMRGSTGDIMDMSAELSEKRRVSAGGEDPVKRQHFNDYEKKVGKKHLKDKPSKIDTKHAVIDFD